MTLTRKYLLVRLLVAAAALGSVHVLYAAEKQISKRDLRAIVERQQAIFDIQDLMSRHAYYYSAGEHQRELDELWSDAPDISWGSDEGWWVGRPLLEDYYVRYFDSFRARDLAAFSARHPEIKDSKENLGAGSDMFHTNTTPLIVIADDGKTAKGLWYSIGQVTQTPGGKQSPMFMWERYGVDFIKENGHWKIWHLFVHTDWSAGPGQSWAAEDQKPWTGADGAASGGGQAGESSEAPKPTVSNSAPNRRALFLPPTENPRIPVPYKTFSETFSYGKR